MYQCTVTALTYIKILRNEGRLKRTYFEEHTEKVLGMKKIPYWDCDAGKIIAVLVTLEIKYVILLLFLSLLLFKSLPKTAISANTRVPGFSKHISNIQFI